MLGLAQLESGWHGDAAEQMRQCLAKRGQPVLSPINKDILKAAPRYCLALCLAALGQKNEAEQTYLAALEEEPKSRLVRFAFTKFLFERGKPMEALNLANALIAENNQDLQVWLFGGYIALSRPEFLPFAQDWTGEAIKHCPEDPSVILQRAEALTLDQQTVLAHPLWIKAHSPNSPRHLAALTLCEMLAGNCRRAFDPAAEELVSREFIKWYRQLIAYKANGIVNQVNENLDELRAILPGAADVLAAAMKKAEMALAV
jgi:tetratricopeptide (TPR) repeat protein